MKIILNNRKSLEDFAKEKISKIHISPKDNEYKSFWVGKLSFDGKIVKVIEDLKFFNYNMEDNNYKIEFSASIGIQWNIENNILYFNKDKNDIELVEKNNLEKKLYYSFRRRF